ncbi:hypothetical protein HLK59_10200 [Streptomyces sp. S3(2020)]|uniref:hypothetical protein n=1 Tax=Streptomyces sp. S3(2020) TaxID=2732044 RepID=UPI001488BC6A|nr:hypothetical protein [Streptomyces sp. S3(2020)]NNN30728.1 hypothetical protein [Streptomyces sp. S3(2020)]
MGPINWGDAPTWIAGAFAAAAAFYARGTLKSQQQQISEQRDFIAEQAANLRLERQVLQEQLGERRSAQARQIRLAYSAGGGEFDDETGDLVRADHWLVTVRNESDAPVYELTVSFAGEPSRWVQTSERAGGGGVAVLGRGKGAEFDSPRFPDTQLVRARPVARFRDADGVWWQLLHDERLTEAEPPDQS